MSELGCFGLKDAVTVAIRDGQTSAWKEGIITGRTLEQNARYDVRFADGAVELNVAAERIRPREGSQNAQNFRGISGGRDRD